MIKKQSYSRQPSGTNMNRIVSEPQSYNFFLNRQDKNHKNHKKMLISLPYYRAYNPYRQYLSVDKKNPKEFGILASKSRKIRHKTTKKRRK